MKVYIHGKRQPLLSRRLSAIERAYKEANRTLTKEISDEVASNLRSLTDDELVRVYTMAQNFERKDFVRVLRRILDRRGIDTFKHSF